MNEVFEMGTKCYKTMFISELYKLAEWFDNNNIDCSFERDGRYYIAKVKNCNEEIENLFNQWMDSRNDIFTNQSIFTN